MQYFNIKNFLPHPHGATAIVDQGFVIVEASRSHSGTPHSVGFLRLDGQPYAETSTLQHAALTRDKHPFPPAGFEPAVSVIVRLKTRLRLSGHWDRQTVGTAGCTPAKMSLNDDKFRERMQVWQHAMKTVRCVKCGLYPRDTLSAGEL